MRPRPARHFHSALLLGEDHTELEEVAIREITPNLAIGISRGRFPKGYAHVDPNEDAAYAATDGTTTILAVADGHHGFDAARAAIIAIADAAPLVTDMPPEAGVRRLAESAIQAVAALIPSLPAPRNTSRTSLTICAIRANTIVGITLGDTACLVARRRRLTQLGKTSDFLSADSDPMSIRVETASLRPGNSIVLATDGLLDFAADVRGSLRTVADTDAVGAFESLISAAFAGGAGDNIAIAVSRHS